jgi:hypothetical protein
MRNHLFAIVTLFTLVASPIGNAVALNGFGNEPPKLDKLESEPCIQFALKLFKESDDPFSQSAFNTVTALIDDKFATSHAVERQACAAKALQYLTQSMQQPPSKS